MSGGGGGRIGWLAVGLGWLLPLAPARAADPAPPVAAVEAMSLAGELGCRVMTNGLPAEATLRSVQGGLPSALHLTIELIDGRDQLVQRRQFSLRVAFDLWDEIFHVDGAGLERRFGSVDSLRAALRALGPFPVVSGTALAAGERYRLRVELLEQRVAPSQRARVGEILAGSDGPARGGRAGDEMVLGFGKLIQFIYGRDRGGDAPQQVALSAWFTREVLLRGSP